MTTEIDPQSLHRLFCLRSRQTLAFPHFRFRWEAWSVVEGHTEANLVLVLEYLNHRRATASEEKYKPSIVLNKFLDDAGWFACQVQAAESWQREQNSKKRQISAPTGKSGVLREFTKREQQPPDRTVTPAQILTKSVPELVAAMRAQL